MSAYTLVTGASEGLGREFARIAAAEGRNVILTARSEDKLKSLEAELAEKAEVVVIPADLSREGEAARLWSEASKGREIDVLVNNAGLGRHGPFIDGSGWEREKQMIDVNVTALTALMKLAIPAMLAQGGGRVLNVASTAGFVPGPSMAVYHATKAYVLSLSAAASEELRNTRVSVTALCPGATATNFAHDANMTDARNFQGRLPTAYEVAISGWRAMRARERTHVPGARNKLTQALGRFLPAPLTARLTGKALARV